MFFSLIYFLGNIKAQNFRDFRLPFIFDVVSGTITFYTFNYVYTKRRPVGYEQINSNYIGGDPMYVIEPIYEGETFADLLVWLLPLGLFFFSLMVNPERKGSKFENFLILFPWYLFITYLVIFFKIDMRKPS